MRMRLALPLDPPLDLIRAKTVKKGSRTKKQRARTAPTRTVDPLSWSSTHISSIFSGRQWEHVSTAAQRARQSKGVSTEVERILEVSSPTPSGNDQTPPCRARPGGLLSAMFGEADTDWGGTESIDSDVEMADIPRAPSDPLEPNDFSVVPADERKGGPPLIAGKRTSQSSTKNQLKGLYSPLREVGFSLIGHLNLDTDLDEPAFPNAAGPAPFAPSSCRTLSVAIFPSLPFFFPRNLKGRVQLVGFPRTEAETEICARYEAACRELTRERKRRHREAAKSRRR
ncbi:hypothetical protein V8E53_014508 [Lactarius tabidus]